MSQAPTDGKNLLDPFGVWKAARDANLEAWSKMMIDVVNSDEYSQATGLALENILATSQPMRDAIERTMTQTLSMLNMPSRSEVTTLAERLVNVEMRLDDLDAKLSAVQKSLQETTRKTIHETVAAQDTQLKKIETQLEAIATRIGAMQTPVVATVQPEAKNGTRRQPANKQSKPAVGSPVKEQEVK